MNNKVVEEINRL